jgi:hypothetical protein
MNYGSEEARQGMLTACNCPRKRHRKDNNININTMNVEINETDIIALEGLAAVVNCVSCSALVPGSTFYVHPVTPAVPYLLTELAGCSVGRGE